MHIARWGIAGVALAVAAALGVAGTFTPYSTAQSNTGLEAELKTAAFHAGELAGKATTVATVQLHLHHVINCFVGPNDKMFDAQAGDPCKGQGNGILADIQAGMGKDPQYYEAGWVVQTAEQAIMSNNLDEAKAGAHVASLIIADLQKMK